MRENGTLGEFPNKSREAQIRGGSRGEGRDVLRQQVGQETTPQERAQQFEQGLRQGITDAVRRVDDSFGGNLFQEGQHAFHRVTHTGGVIDRFRRIARAVQQVAPEEMTDRQILLGEFIAASHDEIQDWTPNSDGTDPQGRPTRRIQRDRGNNERRSAANAVAYLEGINKESGEEVYSARKLQTVRNAIDLTIPNFDLEKGTVTQPDFGNFSDDIVAQGIALADLGGGGMEGFPTARWEADALLVEENLDFAAYVKRVDAGGRRDPAEEAKYTDRMVNWLESQVHFTRGRITEFEEEIETMNPLVQVSIRDLFNNYEETIEGTQGLVVMRRRMDFPTWVADLKTTLDNPPRYQ